MDVPQPMRSPDVWQQLHDLRLSEPYTRLISFLAKVLNSPVTTTATTATQHSGTSSNAAMIAATIMPVAPSSAEMANGMGLPLQSESIQLFGLFVSRYFLLSLLIGFVISRIHVLVHRQRVRPLGIWARIAVFLPTHILLLRALCAVCASLSTIEQSPYHTKGWMQGPIQIVSRFALNRHWVEQSDIGSALWQAFATTCLFDCVDVFVARLEGSPCAPYEYIGGLIERTSLYYFYGGTLRIQELVLLNVLEKLLVSHTLIMVRNGWKWRLIPTGVSNLLTLHHFAFSMRNYSGPQLMYPLVQVLSMALLGASLLIVLSTVFIRWLATAVDKYGIVHRRSSAHLALTAANSSTQSAVALYDRHGVFQGVRTGTGNIDDDEIGSDGHGDGDGDGDDESAYELAQAMYLPLYTDMRRDFSVEILDLAGTCLQQCSNQIRSSGFSRQCGVMRLPRTTALDEYIDRAIARSENTRNVSAEAMMSRNAESLVGRCQISGGGGMSVFIDDEVTALPQVPSSSIDIAGAFRDTRVNSVRKLSVALWSLCVAIGYYVLERKAVNGGPGPTSTKTAGSSRAMKSNSTKTSRIMKGRDNTESSDCESSNGFATAAVLGDDEDDDDDEDFDYVVESDNEDSSTDTEDSLYSDTEQYDTGGDYNEAAELVCDILSNPDDGECPEGRLASTVSFIAHSLIDALTPRDTRRTTAVVTRSMFARQLSLAANASDMEREPNTSLMLQLLSGAHSGEYSTRNSYSGNQYNDLPFVPSEVETLAQLIQSRRRQTSDTLPVDISMLVSVQ
ncbi:hypothetical protein GGI07_004166 [Coemansia sp. Benny D115]|nr:hypothetical protein GGI07_004166 [Coemansia sp. Benny D115]